MFNLKLKDDTASLDQPKALENYRKCRAEASRKPEIEREIAEIEKNPAYKMFAEGKSLFERAEKLRSAARFNVGDAVRLQAAESAVKDLNHWSNVALWKECFAEIKLTWSALDERSEANALGFITAYSNRRGIEDRVAKLQAAIQRSHELTFEPQGDDIETKVAQIRASIPRLETIKIEKV
jgi:hypothetical protein